MSGRRVAVTSVGNTAVRIGADLSRAGLEPVFLPCIDVIPRPEDVLAGLRHRSAGCDWLVVTSARAIELLWPAGRMPGRLMVAAVGEGTAAAVRNAGGNVALVGSNGSATLVGEMAGVVTDATICYPHARGADPATAVALRATGARLVDEWVYDTRPTRPGHGHVDAVTFASRSAVQGWALGRRLDNLVIAAIGTTTARALEAIGHHAHVLPSTPSFEGLAAALAAYMSDRSHT